MAIDICRSAEATVRLMENFSQNAEVHAFRQKNPRTKPPRRPRPGDYSAASSRKECKFCGSMHEMVTYKCPAYGRSCSKCHGQNHFAVKCPKKTKPVHIVQEADLEYTSDSDTEWIHAVNSSDGRQLKCRVLTGKNCASPVTFQIDTGASVNTITQRHASWVCAISDMIEPTNCTELNRFIGTVNYIGNFIPHLSETLLSLTSLLRKDVSWPWSSTQQDAFEKAKDLVTSALTLAFYNPEKELILECDASEYGLGAALFQDGEPLAFASRTLSDPGRRYAQIEKEMLYSCQLWLDQVSSLSHPGIPGVTLCFCTGSYAAAAAAAGAAAGRRFLSTR